MAKINFNLKTPKQKKSLVLLKYRLPKGRLIKSTGVNIPTAYWDREEQRIIADPNYDEAIENQHELDKIYGAVKKVERDFYRKEIIPTTHAFREALDEQLGTGSNKLTGSFNHYIQEFIYRRDKSADFKPGSIKVYRTLKNHFTKYIRNRSVQFEDLNVEFLEGFIKYLRNKGYADNYVNKMYGTLRTILNEATELKVNTNLDFKSSRLRVPKRDADDIYLNMKEIQAIYALNLEDKSYLAETRDLFLIGCYTGLRYSDFNGLIKENIVTLSNGSKALRIIAQKTDQIIYIPLHPIAEDILEKYDYVLPKGICNQVMNRHLKEIARLAKINSIYLKRMFRSNKVSLIKKPKCEFVCTHTARRSFATNAFKAKIPMASIMKITGHKRPDTFMKYLKLSNEEHAELMSENEFFK